MSKKKTSLTAAQRHAAAVDMTNYYLSSYWTDWRYVHILTTKKLLDEKYNFFHSIVKDSLKEADEASIAQEIKHGLYHDAIAQCVQYIEDLFALFYASKEPDYFIRNIVSYSAGQVTNLIKGFKGTDQRIKTVFFIPEPVESFSSEHHEYYNKGLKILKDTLAELIEFYIGYEFFYTQYKHGLSIPLRTFCNRYSQDQIEKEKKGEMPNWLAVFDNLNLKAATVKKNFNTSRGLFFPSFTDNVRFNLTGLQNEDNYLRFVFPPDIDVTIDYFVKIAHQTRYCINIFRTNFLNSINSPSEMKIYNLPTDPEKNTTIQITVNEGNEAKGAQ